MVPRAGRRRRWRQVMFPGNRFGPRRLDPGPRALLRGLWPQADVWCGIVSGTPISEIRFVVVPRYGGCRTSGAHGRDLALAWMSSLARMNRMPSPTGSPCHRPGTTSCGASVSWLSTLHPLVPVASAIRASLDRLVGRLEQGGGQGRPQQSAPAGPCDAGTGLCEAASLGRGLGLRSCRLAAPRRGAASLPVDDDSVTAWLLRGVLLRSRDWFAVDQARVHLQRQWRALFREWDVVLCPTMVTPAFPHDHTPDITARYLDVDGKPFVARRSG